MKLSAAVALIAAGDFDAIARRIRAKASGRPPLLPADLAPRYRESDVSIRTVPGGERRILMASPAPSLSGAPLSQLELAQGLRARGWDINSITARSGPAAAKYEAAGVRLECDPVFSVPQYSPAVYERGVAALADFLKRRAPAFVYANTLDLFPVIDAACVAGISSIWNIRESEPWRTRLADRHPDVAARALAAFRYPQCVIFVADAARKAWSAFTANNSAVVYNAPPPGMLSVAGDREQERKRLGALESDTLLVSVGTICERKGQLDIARALAALPQDLSQKIRVAFIGDADAHYLARLKSALPAPYHDRVMFTGAVAEGARLIAAADALINTSRSEAFPRTFIEAAAANVAIVAADVDGAGERLRDGESALFYRPGDSTRLGELMAAIISDGELRKRLAAGARQALVESWTYDEMISAYEGCFWTPSASETRPL